MLHKLHFLKKENKILIHFNIRRTIILAVRASENKENIVDLA